MINIKIFYKKNSIFNLLMLTSINIVLQLMSAFILKIGAAYKSHASLELLLLFSIVIFLNFSRFLVWGVIHKYYDLSIAYPVSALFFPCIVLMAYWFGEPVATKQVIGVLIVTIGIMGLLTSPHCSQQNREAFTQ